MTRWGATALYATSLLGLGCGRHGFDVLAGAGGPGDGGGVDTGLPGDVDPAQLPFNLVFVTSSSARPADLGGLAGADAVCNALAAARGLPGTYVAWLSDSTTSAASRLSGARAWARVDGKPVVDTVDDLVSGRMLHPILLAEDGTVVSGQFGIMTATTPTGTLAANCNDFTSTSSAVDIEAGIASATRDTWTKNIAGSCDGTMRHYCFGVDRDVPLTYTPATGRRAFASSASWLPSGGVAGADAACQAAADARSLGGTWRALMATTTESAASRFSATGAPWVRLDGIALASSPATLLNGMMLDAPLNLTEDGDYRASGPAITGATSTTALGTPTSTCLDWSSVGTGDSQRVGLLNSITLYFSTPIFQTCSSGGGALYCLEP